MCYLIALRINGRCNPNYKNTKNMVLVYILSFGFRLASRLLKEMIIDFQRDAMDHVIQKIFSLEFK